MGRAGGLLSQRSQDPYANILEHSANLLRLAFREAQLLHRRAKILDQFEANSLALLTKEADFAPDAVVLDCGQQQAGSVLSRRLIREATECSRRQRFFPPRSLVARSEHEDCRRFLQLADQAAWDCALRPEDQDDVPAIEEILPS